MILRNVVLILLWPCTVFAQRPPDIKLNPEMNRQVVEGIIRAVNKYYVSSEIAGQVDARLRQRLLNKEYDKITSAFDLIDTLDNHLQTISKDKHLALGYSHEAEALLEGRDFEPETAKEKEEGVKAARSKNFGFEKAERLDGNIGYLEMNSFIRPEFSGETARSVMNFLANTDALIIDLRKSGGGSADMVVFLASYFFDEEPFHLGEVYRTSRTDSVGTGVTPDIEMGEDKALTKAHIEAVKSVALKKPDEKDRFDRIIQGLTKELESPSSKK